MSQDGDIIAEGRALYRSVGDWLPSHDVTAPRVWAGDRIYQNAAQVGCPAPPACFTSVLNRRRRPQILLLREILNMPPEDEAVQRHADIVITLCLQCGQSELSVE